MPSTQLTFATLLKHPSLRVSIAIALLAPAISPIAAQAQITPDGTLGGESSMVTEGAIVQGDLADLIEGGTVRGGNLFHSFLEFNVNEGQRAYFANPVAIENILSRITGGDPSNIFGTLGVDGLANLFLLNPNGIIFGPDATLDIEGSFHASAADAIAVGEGVYSATAPEQSSLLTVDPSIAFINYLNDESGDINNQGQLAAQGDLTLAANNLDLQGQVAAGGELTLLGLDTVQIRDTVDTPFIGFAGGDLLVQGNEQVDIVALSHPDSGLYSYGDMVLRSANPVAGDAHYWSGGNFRAERLDGQLGRLYSPDDPVIRSQGDVSFFAYQGGSLHILSGGQVDINTVVITDSDSGGETINPIATPTLANITLSNGSSIVIDGDVQPVLDIRAGMESTAIGVPLGTTGSISGTFFDSSIFPTQPPSNSSVVTDANIIIGDAVIVPDNGIIFLSNQYQPDRSLLNGSINITGTGVLGSGIDARSFNGDSSSVILDSRGNIAITNSSIDSSSTAGNSGAITLIANNSISLENSPILSDTAGLGRGGNITIVANELIAKDGAVVSASTTGEGTGGNLIVNASETVQLIGTRPDNSQFPSGLVARTFGDGDGGDLLINTRNLVIQDGALVSTSTFGEGQGGSLTVNSLDSVEVIGTTVDSQFGSILFATARNFGSAGSLTINTSKLSVRDGAQVSVGTFSEGQGGDLVINATESIELIGTSSNSNAGLFARAEGNGSAGNVRIMTGILTIQDRAQIDVGTLDMGTGGRLIINAEQLVLENAGGITSSTFGSGNAGDIAIHTTEIDLSGTTEDSEFSSGIFARVGSPTSSEDIEGGGGNLVIETERLRLQDGAKISTEVFGNASGGNLNIVASDFIELLGRSAEGQTPSALFSRTEGPTELAQAGDLTLTTNRLIIQDGAQISTSTFGSADAGDLNINAVEIELSGTSINGFSSGLFAQANNGSGNGGDLFIETERLFIRNGAQVTAATIDEGQAGNLEVNGSELVSVSGTSAFDRPSRLLTQTDGNGNAGDLAILVRNVLIRDGGFIGSGTGTFSEGNGGNLYIQATESVEIDNASISAESRGLGRAGSVIINANDFFSAADSNVTTIAQTAGGDITIAAGKVRLHDNSDIATNVRSGTGGNITLVGNIILAFDDSDILAFATDGRGGNITLDTPIFFGENFIPGSPSPFDGNNRVDINATGSIASGNISIPDVSFIENSLNELSGEIVDTATLTAGSCIARNDDTEGSFIVTGGEGLPQQPGSDTVSAYPTGTVQSIPATTATLAIQEPQSVYRLADGRLVLSHECER